MPVVALAYDTREVDQFVARARPRRRSTACSCGRATPASCSRSSSTSRTGATSRTTPATMGVQVILVIEDNVRYYSSFLPAIYAELTAPLAAADRRGRQPVAQAHAHAGAAEDPAVQHFEEAWALFADYRGERARRDLGRRVPARRRASRARPGSSSRASARALARRADHAAVEPRRERRRGARRSARRSCSRARRRCCTSCGGS